MLTGMVFCVTPLKICLLFSNDWLSEQRGAAAKPQHATSRLRCTKGCSCSPAKWSF